MMERAEGKKVASAKGLHFIAAQAAAMRSINVTYPIDANPFLMLAGH